MPIECNYNFKPATQSQFRNIDYQVTGLAFDIHNKRGNLWDEAVYQKELLNRLTEKNLQCESEIQIKLIHQSFTKNYYIDLITEGCLFELKTCETITGEHIAQTLNYLFLTDSRHASIINFRPNSVEKRFVSTSLDRNDRYCITIEDSDWKPITSDCSEIRNMIENLLNDWGTYLDLSLYIDAICSLLEIRNKNPLLHFSDKIAIHFSKEPPHKSHYKNNLIKYLSYTSFAYVHWINLNKANIELLTIANHSANNHSA